jgi:hypothetical protein
MGKGFGRGAKSVAIVTHAQVKGKKKLPKGLRGNRKKKRRMFHAANDEQTQLEQSLGMNPAAPGKKPATADAEPAAPFTNKGRSLAQQIAGIKFQHMVNKRQRGFKSLRKQLLASVKDVRRRHAEKGKRRNQKDAELLAERYRAEQRKGRKVSGNTRRNNADEDA